MAAKPAAPPPSMAGKLTAWDRRLLGQYLHLYQALDAGEREPNTEAQQHFVAVCRGTAKARTEHEIVYSRYRALADAVEPSVDIPAPPPAATTIASSASPHTTARSVSRYIELLKLEAVSSRAEAALDSLSTLCRRGGGRARLASAETAKWVSTLLADRELAGELEHWTGQLWGGLSDAYTRALDGAYLEGLKQGADYVAPIYHRFEGHSLLDAWEAACRALPDDSLRDENMGCLRALASDVVTPAGLPFVGMAPEKAKAFASGLGLPETWVLDAMGYTLVEAVQAAIPGIALALNWSQPEAETFARLVGALGVGAAVAANPLLAILAVAALARGFHKSRRSAQDGRRAVDPGTWARGLAQGGLLSGAILAISAAIGGPAAIGLLAGAAVVAVGVRRGTWSRWRELREWLARLAARNAARRSRPMTA